jgi:hypothetical protein
MRHAVLVVDSDPRTRNLLRASLERRSFAAVEAPDPVSVLTKLDGVVSLAARIRALLADDIPNAVPRTRPSPERLELRRVFRVHGPVRGWNALYRLCARP